MKLKKLYLLAFMSSALFFSCSSDDDAFVEQPLGAYDRGILILNEGNFGQDNSSLSFLSNDFVTFQNNAFLTVNPTKILGNTAQDIGFYNDFAFIVVNASNKIEIVNRYTLQYVATINTGLANPRYITFVNGKGYVTNWGDGGVATDDYVAVVDLTTYAVTATIPVVEGPERILQNNNKLYVAHKGGFNQGNTVSVIELANSTITSITVGDVPNSIELVGNDLYVLCGGKPSWTGAETTGELVKINTLTNTKTTKVFSGLDFKHPSNLDFEANTFYYTIGSKVYKMGINDATLPTTELFSTVNQGAYGVYSFAVNNGKIYMGDAKDYNSNGEVYVYSLTGSLLKNATVGVIPTGFYFNN